jgi:hypothetical protein
MQFSVDIKFRRNRKPNRDPEVVVELMDTPRNNRRWETLYKGPASLVGKMGNEFILPPNANAAVPLKLRIRESNDA